MIKFSDINDQYLNREIHVRIADSGNVYTDVLRIERLNSNYTNNIALSEQSFHPRPRQHIYSNNFPFSKKLHEAFYYFSDYAEHYKAFRCINGRCF